MQHSHEALNNAKNILKTPGTYYKATSTWKIEAKQMQFPEPNYKCQHLQQLLCNSRGGNVQRRETEALDQWIRHAG